MQSNTKLKTAEYFITLCRHTVKPFLIRVLQYISIVNNQCNANAMMWLLLKVKAFLTNNSSVQL